mmetsp:Transcript_11403/g.28356  ORF Transcript_11403/g.28356 Transcript_11403/m.28356 type:complete len:329 (-) Transcript_11403:92-1078(-)
MPDAVKDRLERLESVFSRAPEEARAFCIIAAIAKKTPISPSGGPEINQTVGPQLRAFHDVCRLDISVEKASGMHADESLQCGESDHHNISEGQGARLVEYLLKGLSFDVVNDKPADPPGRYAVVVTARYVRAVYQAQDNALSHHNRLLSLPRMHNLDSHPLVLAILRLLVHCEKDRPKGPLAQGLDKGQSLADGRGKLLPQQLPFELDLEGLGGGDRPGSAACVAAAGRRRLLEPLQLPLVPLLRHDPMPLLRLRHLLLQQLVQPRHLRKPLALLPHVCGPQPKRPQGSPFLMCPMPTPAHPAAHKPRRRRTSRRWGGGKRPDQRHSG